jgi:hypothetical protein
MENQQIQNFKEVLAGQLKGHHCLMFQQINISIFEQT